MRASRNASFTLSQYLPCGQPPVEILRQYLAFRIAFIAASQQGRLILWLPVFMIAGVLAYFTLRFEPPPWLGSATFVALAAASSRAGFWGRVAILPIAAAALGFASAQLATLRALPVQPLPRGAVVVTAIVRGVDLLPQGRRIILSQVRLDDGPRLPRAIRVRLRNNDPAVIAQGDTIRLRALVETPPPPAYPGAWDLSATPSTRDWAAMASPSAKQRSWPTTLAMVPPPGSSHSVRRSPVASRRRFREHPEPSQQRS
jgi:hypothetical protein